MMNHKKDEIPLIESEKDRKMRLERQKMQRQFEGVPYLIFIYVGQLLAIFVHTIIYTNNLEKFTYSEKIIAMFLMGLFYLFYLNGLIKFVRSFYQIMQTAKIDDSDLVQIEVYITFALGVVFNIYGAIYFRKTESSPKNNQPLYGLTSLTIGVLLWLQAFFTRQFYIVAAENLQKTD